MQSLNHWRNRNNVTKRTQTVIQLVVGEVYSTYGANCLQVCFSVSQSSPIYIGATIFIAVIGVIGVMTVI